MASGASHSAFQPEKHKDTNEVTLEEFQTSKVNRIAGTEDVKAPGLLQRAKEEVEAVVEDVSEALHLHPAKSPEKSLSINENTKVEDVKAPDLFHRVKEEFEAIAETIAEKIHGHRKSKPSEKRRRSCF